MQKITAASLQKLFIIDDQGVYAGEYAVEDECTIEFDDFVKVVGDMALEDSQTVFVGEYKATMLHGARLSLIAISRGPLSSQELTWAKATLIAVEATMGKQPEEPKVEVDAKATPDDLKVSPENNLGVDLAGLQEKIQEVESRLAQETESSLKKSAELKAKEEKLKEIEADALAAKEREVQLLRDIEGLKTDLTSARAEIPEDLAQAREDLETRIKILQRKAFELLDHEERLRKREQELSRLVASE